MAETKMDTSADIDEGLYSRQLYVLGHEAMKKMSSSNVLISGVRGLGVEIAKNVILGGVKSIAIHDPEDVALSDLSSQYYLTEDDVGKNRAEVSVPRLGELNPYVPVSVFDKPLTPENLDEFQVIVLTNSTTEEELTISDYTHSKNKACIIARSHGLFGQIFCDFGEKFVVYDVNDAQPASCHIASITNDGDGVVTTLDDTRHGLEDGAYVTFSEIEGMTELNNCAPMKIKYLGPYTFSIGDTSKFSPYTKGGIVTQVKMPVELSFKSFRQALKAPELVLTDYEHFTRGNELHVGFQALDIFKGRTGAYPRPGNKSDGDQFVQICNEVNDGMGDIKLEEMDESVLRQLASQATGQVCPMDAVLGGVAAQEVMKACSGKFSPIYQFAYFDSMKSLPESGFPTESDLQPIGSRYDGLIAVFGKQFVDRMKKQKWFVVGAGAIGCELLKLFAMLGLGASPEGKLTVTDMDTIEKSNLNRQFLFRPWDVQKLKSTVAAKAAQAMNPDLNIEAHSTKVGPDTEDIYDDAFFQQLDGVANALDNVEARQYMDRRCVFYRLPLLESGTLGTQGSTQVVLPDVTASYSSTQDPPEKGIPICTLKNFPYKIEHTIQWARDLFEGTFAQVPQSTNQYLTDGKKYIDTLIRQGGSQPYQTIKGILESLVENRPLSFEDCVAWARIQFQEQFHNNIAQMLYTFPADKVNEDGQPFWSGTKRLPQAHVFDPRNDLHMDFIVAAANLRANIYGLKGTRDVDAVRDIAAKAQVPEFKPRTGVKIETDEKKAEQQQNTASYQEDELETLVARLPAPGSMAGFKLAPEDFEKDDDSNFHIDFVTAASNLRATNYKIEPADRHSTKRIAGKIIPAIATTTAFVAGLVGLELCKLVNGNKDIDNYISASANLSIPCFHFFAPQAAPKNKYNDVEWTLWDRFEVQGDITLQQLIDLFQEQHKLEITMLSSGVSMLYSFFMPPDKRKRRLAMKVSEIVEEVTKAKIPDHMNHLILEVCVDDAEGEDVDVPFVLYKLK